MATEPSNVALTLVIQATPETDASDLDQTTRYLLAELRELDIESAELMTGDAPPVGAKTADAFSVGALVLTCLPAAIPKLLEYLQNWKKRRPDHQVKIKTQVGDRTVEVQFPPGAVSVEQLKSYVDMLTEKLDR
jgi:hypothetical protein